MGDTLRRTYCAALASSSRWQALGQSRSVQMRETLHGVNCLARDREHRLPSVYNRRRVVGQSCRYADLNTTKHHHLLSRLRRLYTGIGIAGAGTSLATLYLLPFMFPTSSRTYLHLTSARRTWRGNALSAPSPSSFCRHSVPAVLTHLLPATPPRSYADYLFATFLAHRYVLFVPLLALCILV